MSQAEYEFITNICEIGYVILQAIIFLVLWDVFYRTGKGKKNVAAAGIFVTVNVLITLCHGIPTGARFVISAGLVVGYCKVRYGKYLEKAVFVLLLFYNFHGLSVLISNSAYQYVNDSILRGIDVLDAEYSFHMYKSMVFGVFCLILSYVLALLLMTGTMGKIVKKPLDMNQHAAVFLSALNIVGGMLARMVIDLSIVQIDQGVFLLFEEKREMLWKLPVIAIFLYLGELSVVYLYQKNTELQSEKQKHFVEEQQIKAMKRRLEEAENFYGSVRKVRHEMKSHMTNIKGLVANEKYGEVEDYIEKLDETIQTLEYKFNTGNAVSDVIINDKYRKAASLGIPLQVKGDFRETDTIPVFDIGIVLNNLLDNAIEACEKVEQRYRYILLTLRRKNHFLLIEVENSFDGELKWEGGDAIPATTKQSDLPGILMEHGIGLRNVKEVADRYLGDMDIKVTHQDDLPERNIFKIIVMLQERKNS